MKPKQQRLILGMLALVAVAGAGLLALVGLRNQAAFFYAPADVQKQGVPMGKAIRLGGMVANHSIRRDADGVTIHFIVEDGIAQIAVRFRGITPDLFRERSGVIADGHFVAPGQFEATTILAKHDEKYVAPEMKGMKPQIGRVS